MQTYSDPSADNPHPNFRVRPYDESDLERLHVILRRAFAPIAAGFQQQLGDEIFNRLYPDLTRKQEGFLASLLDGSDRKEVHVLLLDDTIIGFIGLVVDEDGIGGELELNAVDPAYQRRGGGQFMYAFAVERMRQKGVRLLRVGTGADENHRAAREAYRRVGFDRTLSWTVLYQLL